MNPYLLVPLTSAVASAALAAAIFCRDPKQRANRLAALMVAAVAFWSLCEVLWNLQTDAGVARILQRISALGWVFLGPLALDLIREVTGESTPARRRTHRRLYLFASIFLWASLFTPWMHGEPVKTSWGWGYEVRALHAVYQLFSIGCALVGLAAGRRAYATAVEVERTQALFVCGGILVPLVVATATDSLLPQLGFQPPRLGTASMTIFALSIAWGFTRYGYSLLAPGTFAKEILDTLPNGVAMVRLDGRIRSVNATMERMVGAPSQALVGADIGQLLSGAELDFGRELSEVQCQMETLGGRRFPVSVSSTLLCDREQQPIGSVLVARDVREMVALRSRLAMSDRIAAIGKIAAGIAHEINNPLAYVRSNLSMLREHWDEIEKVVAKADAPEYTSALISESEEMIDESLEGVDRAVAIVRDVRGLSHVERAERDSTDVCGLLDGAIRIARSQLPCEVTIVKEYCELPPVECSPQELHQVFLNLVMNAGQAVGEHGRIQVVTRQVDHQAVVSVVDDGCGIAAEAVARIFDPFYTTKPVGEGTGLGLGIAREIVQRHGGDIEVESFLGTGSVFCVRLPIHTDEVEPRQPV